MLTGRGETIDRAIVLDPGRERVRCLAAGDFYSTRSMLAWDQWAMDGRGADTLRVVSGGQTGVDRAALDAALDAGVSCAGWCPEGRMAEDGRIPDHYPLVELKGGGYRQRTLRNLEDSDGTLILTYGSPQGGTALTLAGCVNRGKPYLLIDAEQFSVEQTITEVLRFLLLHKIRVLNVAGPRASGEEGAYRFAYAVISGLLRSGADTL